QRYAGQIGPEFFRIFQNPFVDGWEVQAPQPPHIFKEKRAAGFLIGEDGNKDIGRVWLFQGWEIQPPQPPRRGRVVTLLVDPGEIIVATTITPVSAGGPNNRFFVANVGKLMIVGTPG